MTTFIDRAAFLCGTGAALVSMRATPASAADGRYIALTHDVGYVRGDIEKTLTCNTGVVASQGALTIVDAALPGGASAALGAIRTHTSLPLARVFDTHYHLDHSYGNAFWHDHGAAPIAYQGVRTELQRAEPELFGGGPGLWQKMTATLPELRSSRPLAPAYVGNMTEYGAGKTLMRVMHFGVAHTHSDAVLWLPARRVLFTGDLVANGPFNAVADSTISAWIAVLDRLRALRPQIVVPGHGAAGGPELIDLQQRYFVAVTQAVDAVIARGEQLAKHIPALRRKFLDDPRYAHFVNDHRLPYSGFFAFHDLAAKIYGERTGKTLARERWMPRAARCCGDLLRNVTT